MIRLPALPKLPSALLWAVAASLATAFVLHSCERPPPPVLVVRTDTADASQWRTRAAALQHQMADTVGALARLRRTLEGRDTRRPATVTVYDTVVQLQHDTVTLALAVDSHGRLTQTVALPADSGGHRPADTAPIPVATCDDGFRVVGLAVECDRARAGHLVAFVGAGLASEPWGQGLPPPVRPHLAAGLRWTPSFRSLWSVELRGDAEGRVVLAVRRGLRLF